MPEEKFYGIIEEIGGERMPSLAERWYKQGLQKGIQKGKQEGIEEGIQKGKQEGLKEGLQKGIREGLLEAIELDLELKFGERGKRLINKIKKIENIAKLREIKKLIFVANSIEDINKVL